MADISITAANVLPSSAATIQQGTAAAGVTITAGVVVYQLTAGTFGLADSDGTTPANTVAGIAINGCGPGQRFLYASEDPVFTFGGTCVVATGALYLADTPGGITQTLGDLESGDKVIMLGVPLTTTTIYLKPLVGGTI